jgi:NADPH:quinone reductase-like Zn-dependent oxidoreductase
MGRQQTLAYAVQLVGRADIRITATAATDEIFFLRNLGANTVIDYNTQRFEEEVRDADAVLIWLAVKRKGVRFRSSVEAAS